MNAEVQWINLGFVNCYVIKTDAGFFLVDTGVPALRDALLRKLDAAGCDGGNLKLIIATHGDIDHTGNCKFLREKYGAPVAMHRADLAMVRDGELNPDRTVTSALMRFLQFLMGLTGGVAKMARDFERFTPDLFLEDGQRLDEYGLPCGVRHIPGHTDGSIGLLLDSGDLLCGDTLQNDKPATIIMDRAELRRSIGGLAGMNPKTVYPGHGKPFAWTGLAAR